MRIYRVVDGFFVVCGGCNGKVKAVYFAADSQEDAEEMYRENNRGLCSDCLINLFVEKGYEVIIPVPEGKIA